MIAEKVATLIECERMFQEMDRVYASLPTNPERNKEEWAESRKQAEAARTAAAWAYRKALIAILSYDEAAASF